MVKLLSIHTSFKDEVRWLVSDQLAGHKEEMSRNAVRSSAVSQVFHRPTGGTWL